MNTTKRAIGSFLENRRLAVLATRGDPYPYTSLVFFAVTRGLDRIVFATPRETAKFRNMRADPFVSFLMDDRSDRSGEDTAQGAALTVLAAVREAESGERAACRRLLVKRHPGLAAFCSDPGTALMAATVDRYILVRGLRESVELAMRR